MNYQKVNNEKRSSDDSQPSKINYHMNPSKESHKDSFSDHYNKNSKICLYKHQEKILEQLKGKTKCALYLDMGLGKTFIASEKMKELGENLALIICPKSVIDTWVNHIKTYYPEYYVTTDTAIGTLPKNKKSVIVINYDLIWRRPQYEYLKNYTLILDESQAIKNTNTKRTKFITDLKFKSLILCSGTPTGGKYEELITQCHMLGWRITKESFYNNFVNYYKIKVNGFKIPVITGYKNVDFLKEKLKEYNAIFMKSEEAIELPDQINNIVKVKSTKEYERFKDARIITYKDKELVGDTVLTMSLYLRQLASQYNKNKLQALKDLIESTNDRLVIFYNFKEEKRLIQDMITDRHISYVDGSEKDLHAYDEFDDTITLIQYQAGATGINLQKANKVIYFSLTRSSELFEQSKKRIHRIGQEHTCFYYYLITENSIDEDIYKTLEMRRDYTDELFRKKYEK